MVSGVNFLWSMVFYFEWRKWYLLGSLTKMYSDYYIEYSFLGAVKGEILSELEQQLSACIISSSDLQMREPLAEGD